MTGCCNSNPAQYERNRRFKSLVHVLGRQANGAKLPFEGLWLKASKSASHLDIATITLLLHVGRHRYARPLVDAVTALERDLWLARSSQSRTIYYQPSAMWGRKIICRRLSYWPGCCTQWSRLHTATCWDSALGWTICLPKVPHGTIFLFPDLEIFFYFSWDRGPLQKA